VCAITSLIALNISNNRYITSDGLYHSLRNLHNLRCLNMSYCVGVTFLVLQSIANIALTDLDISWCGIDDECLNAVAKITSLKTLNIMGYNGKITSAGFSLITGLKHIQYLNIKWGFGEFHMCRV